MPSDLSARVTVSGLSAVLALTAAAGWIAGAQAAAGVAGGGAIALVNFRWLARSVASIAALAGENRTAVVGWRGTWLRHLLTVGALGWLVGGGWAHPLGVIVGLSVLPPVLVAQGLHAARDRD